MCVNLYVCARVCVYLYVCVYVFLDVEWDKGQSGNKDMREGEREEEMWRERWGEIRREKNKNNE